MRELGREPSSLEVARFYAGLVDALVVDHADAALCPAIERLGLRAFATASVMQNPQDRITLARQVLAFAAQLAPAAKRVSA
jgi:LPPG:FO 2-phospho-L-lactate transferase